MALSTPLGTPLSDPCNSAHVASHPPSPENCGVADHILSNVPPDSSNFLQVSGRNPLPWVPELRASSQHSHFGLLQRFSLPLRSRLDAFFHHCLCIHSHLCSEPVPGTSSQPSTLLHTHSSGCIIPSSIVRPPVLRGFSHVAPGTSAFNAVYSTSCPVARRATDSSLLGDVQRQPRTPSQDAAT